MKVLVLGASGYVGARLLQLLRDWPGCTAVGASGSGRGGLRLDALDEVALAGALDGMDAVVNCVAGDARTIDGGARALVRAAANAGRPRLVHLSSMAVYGDLQGRVDETAAAGPLLGWYDQAKRNAEAHVAGYARGGGTAVVLRPGCVWGPGSPQWVGRIGRWLRAGRLGDLGAAGDGWSNLVHVDDCCLAVVRALQLPLPVGSLRTWNLAAPDSPRWNEVFTDLALAIGATPVARLSARRLKLDALVAGPALQVARKLAPRAGVDARRLPEPLTPGLLGVFRRQLQLDASAGAGALLLDWTPYPVALHESATWFLEAEAAAQARREAARVKPAG